MVYLIRILYHAIKYDILYESLKIRCRTILYESLKIRANCVRKLFDGTEEREHESIIHSFKLSILDN